MTNQKSNVWDIYLNKFDSFFFESSKETIYQQNQLKAQ
jgi:hypothetical protein